MEWHTTGGSLRRQSEEVLTLFPTCSEYHTQLSRRCQLRCSLIGTRNQIAKDLAVRHLKEGEMTGEHLQNFFRKVSFRNNSAPSRQRRRTLG